MKFCAIDGRTFTTRRSARYGRHNAKFAVFCAVFVAIFANASCFMPNPALSPVADVLIPNENVRVIGFTIAGELMRIGPDENDVAPCVTNDVIVTPEFIQWVELLKIEIKELRKRTP